MTFWVNRKQTKHYRLHKQHIREILKANQHELMQRVSAMVEWLEYPTPVWKGQGSKPARVNNFKTEYSMDVVG